MKVPAQAGRDLILRQRAESLANEICVGELSSVVQELLIVGLVERELRPVLEFELQKHIRVGKEHELTGALGLEFVVDRNVKPVRLLGRAGKSRNCHVPDLAMDNLVARR